MNKHQRFKILLSNGGFSLVEVIVGMLIALLFVTTSLQLMVYAMILAAQGRELSSSKNWIQEDLEQVKSLAAAYKSTTLTASTVIGTDTISVGWVDGFEVGDLVRIGNDPNTYSVSAVGPNQLTLGSSIQVVQAPNTNVSAINMCNATSSASGFGFALRTNLPAVATSTKTIGGKSYTLVRGGPGGSLTPTISSSSPYHILQISYKILPQGETTPIAELETEVIPDAAIKCP